MRNFSGGYQSTPVQNMYGSQEMPMTPNQLLLNGKIFLAESLSNGNNGPLQHYYQYAFPFHVLPNLNSSPEKIASTGMSDDVCYPPTPVTLDKNKRIQDPSPQKVIDLVDGSVINGNSQGEVLQTTAEGVFDKPENGEVGKGENEVIDLNKTPQQKQRRKKHRPKVIREGKSARKPATPKPVTPKPPMNKETPSGKRKYVRKKKIPDNSDTPSCPLGESVDQDNGGGNTSVRRCLNFDSGEPHAKDGCEGQSRIFAPNVEAPQVQDSCIQGTITGKETPSGKRKYVKKQKIPDISDTPSCPLGEVVGQDNVSGTTSVRRCLNFNSKEPQAKDGCKGTSMNFALNAEAPQAQNSCIRGTIISSSNKLNVPSVEGEEVVLENPLTRFMFDLNSSASQDFFKTPQTPTPSSQSSPRMTPQTPSPCSPPSRIETTRPSQWLNWNIGAAKKFPMPPQVPQQTRREILWENLKGFGWKNDCLRIAGPSGISQEAGKKNQPEPNNTTDVPMRGTKRGHNLVNEESLSPHRNSIHASNWINRISETSDTSRHGSYFSESDKKKRTEKGQTELTSNASTPVKFTPSSSLRPKSVVPNSCEVLSFSGEERPINFPESDSKKRTEKGQTELPSNASIPVQRTSSSCLRPKPVVPNDSEFFSFSGAERPINFPESEKKKRTEKGQTELTSNASIPVQRNPSSSLRPKLVVPNNCEVFSFSGAERPRTTSWNTSVLMPSNCEVFTFADAQRLMAHEKTRASECMLSFGQGDTMKMSMIPVQTNNLTSLSMMRVYNNLPTPVKSSGYHNTEGRQPSIPEKTYGCSERQESEAFRPQICSEAINGNDHAKKKTKRKEYTHIVKPMPSNTNGIHFQDDEAASCSNGSLYGKSPVQVTASSLGNFQDKNPRLHISSLQDCQSSNNFKESTHVISVSGAIVPHHDSIDEIVWKLRGLNINGGQKNVASEVQNALVPYGAGGGTVVPYEGPFDPTKKRRPRVKVDLDPETNRVWNVLMGKESSDEKIDMDKEKWWEEERKVFRGRVDSFIARMHLIQGDRRFSRWKGSVVDSVVGVFLTQNVSDHLSSSAFMALAARFPPRSDGDMSKPPNAEKVDSNEPLGCNNGDGDFDNLNGKGCNVPERELEIGRESPPSSSSTPVTVTGVTSIPEAEGRRSMEDVVSSQNSTVSSQNSSEFLVQRADQTQMGSSLNFEDLIYGGVCNGLNNSTSFLDLLQMAETTRLPGLYSHPSVCILNPQPNDKHHHLNGGPWSPSPSYQPQNYSNSRFMANGDVHAVGDGGSSHFPSTRATSTSYDFTGLPWSPSSYQPHNFSSSRFMANGNVDVVGDGGSSHLPSTRSTSRTAPVCDLYAPVIKHSEPPITCSESEVHVGNHSFCPSNLTREKAEGSSGSNTPNKCSHLQDEQTSKLQKKERGVEFITQAQMQSGLTYQTSLNSPNYSRETPEVADAVESNLKPEAASAATANSISKTDKVKPSTGKTKERDWDELRKQAYRDGARKERSKDAMDSLDWEAIRSANVSEISYTIRERGMNNMLAERIKGFLDRIVKDHGSIDLEWLRDVPPDAAKDYLLSIRGLGLKSVECVRLLTLHHLAFPVDTNVGRICVRLGWVPLQPLPESLQLHLLEMYPVLETIQKYIWPRLCKLDQRTLYELHYQMITFGKVFCTKSKPNCNACPMRGECKHFASAFANLRLSLPGPEEKGLVSSTVPISFETDHPSVFNPMHLPQLKESPFSHEGFVLNNCEPIIEEPASPEPEHIKSLESDIEDAFYEDPDEIPMIKLNLEEFTQNVQNYMQENNMELQDGDFSKALVAITPDAASIPTPKLKNVRRLRTEHQVYELPDSHPLLKGLDQREPDDPCSYFLAIWSPGETAQSTELEQESCNSRDTGRLCDKKTCFDCNSIREAHAQTVRGTLLIPCRTAMRGSFPLNGTYFQVNEVFADHASSCNPIDVPRELIWNLPRRTVYFGTSVPTIFKGLTTEEIQHCFWRGFVCVRGFDRATRAPKPLYARLHFPASKTTRNRQAAAGAPAAPAAGAPAAPAAREEE